MLNLVLWLVYLLADSTAIYAIGHLSVTSSHQLVAFWAPLLLVHLGGPDSITAYAIEDTRLWLRHLLTLVVQTLGASYVLYKYVAGATSSGRLLLAASVLMFTVGVLKYGERTWALRCGSMGGIKSRLPTEEHEGHEAYVEEARHVHLVNKQGDNEEELLILAHLQLGTCLQRFAGVSVWSDAAKNVTDHAYPDKGDDMYKLIQMQLSLMHDIIYTKAWVIHTWHGYCIRAVSFVATIASMLLFSFTHKNAYSGVDIHITYFLLAGAVVLEIISVVTTIGSTWMCAQLCSSSSKKAHIKMLVNWLKLLRRRVGAASKRSWSTSIGQYNLLHVCTRDSTELGSRAAEKMGLNKWWTRVHFVGTADISTTHLPGLLLETLPQLDPRYSRGIQVLERSGLGKEQAAWSHWSLNLDFAQSILIWHLATDISFSKWGTGINIYPRKVRDQGDDVAEAVKMLSNYMMFLLVTKPEMLPGYVEETWHDEYWNKPRLSLMRPQRLPKKWSDMFNDGPNGSRIQEIDGLISLLLHRNYKRELEPGSTSSDSIENAKELASELLHLKSTKHDLLKVIFGVWLEMLCYAAQRCGPESHATQLSTGGEFITVVWLLTQQFVASQPEIPDGRFIRRKLKGIVTNN